MQPQPQPSDNLFVAELPEGIQDATVRQLFGQYGTVVDLRVLPGNAAGTAAALIRFAHEEEAAWIVNNVDGNIPEGLSSPVRVRYANSRGAGKGGGKGGGKSSAAYSPQGGMNGGCGGYHPDDVRYNPYGGGCAGGGNSDPWSKGNSDPWSKGDKGKGGGKDKGKEKGIKEMIFGFGSSGILPGGAKWNNDENTVFVGGLPDDTQDVDLYCLFNAFGAIAPRGVKAMLDRDTGMCTGVGFVNFLDAMGAQSAVQSLDGQPTPAGPPLRVSIKQQKRGSAPPAQQGIHVDVSQQQQEAQQGGAETGDSAAADAGL